MRPWPVHYDKSLSQRLSLRPNLQPTAVGAHGIIKRALYDAYCQKRLQTFTLTRACFVEYLDFIASIIPSPALHISLLHMYHRCIKAVGQKKIPDDLVSAVNANGDRCINLIYRPVTTYASAASSSSYC